MENKKLMYLFGIIFSMIFALFYFFIFDSFLHEEKISKTIYFNQVGLYKDSANSEQVIQTFKEKEITCYPVKKDEVTAVVCGVSEHEEETKKQQETFTSSNISFIEKQVVLDTPEILSLWEDNEITTVLEMMKY